MIAAAPPRLRAAELSLAEKLRQLHWPLVALLLADRAGRLRACSTRPAAARTALGLAPRRAVGRRPAVMVAIALVDLRVWFRLSYPLYGAVLALLVAVDMLGEISKGAQRWLDLGLVQLQPSELMKMALVMALARYFHGAYLEDVRRPLVLMPAAAADPGARARWSWCSPTSAPR